MAARPTRLNAYFDTSAFVKLLVREPGTSVVAQAWLAAQRTVSSLLLYTEARAALARVRRMQRISPRQHQKALEQLEVFWRDLARVDVDYGLAYRAGELAEQYALRAYDAVHLASLEQAGQQVTLVSADGDLLRAAHAMGFAVAPVT